MRLLDHGYATKVETWGSDERIIESARMSTAKGFQGWGPHPCKRCGRTVEMCTDMGLAGDTCPDGGDHNFAGDEKLLRYLYEHKHMTPFEMAGMTIEVQAPIFVFREWHRHRTQSYNELSARYTEIPELFYTPSVERLRNGAQSKTNKQAAGEALSPEAIKEAVSHIESNSTDAFESYRQMLAFGVARELARLVLPVNTYSRMRASANLRNWLGFLTLRMDKNAQWEIRQYAAAVAVMVRAAFPRTYELFVNDHK